MEFDNADLCCTAFKHPHCDDHHHCFGVIWLIAKCHEVDSCEREPFAIVLRFPVAI
jgi:hypothetical protein